MCAIHSCFLSPCWGNIHLDKSAWFTWKVVHFLGGLDWKLHVSIHTDMFVHRYLFRMLWMLIFTLFFIIYIQFIIIIIHHLYSIHYHHHSSSIFNSLSILISISIGVLDISHVVFWAFPWIINHQNHYPMENPMDLAEFWLTIIWVNYNNSLTWIKAIWGWFPLLTMISSEVAVRSL